MDTATFRLMLDCQWNEATEAQGEYCMLLRDRLKLHDQETQEELQAYPVVRYVTGSIAAVEVFPGYIDYWQTGSKLPTQGEAIALSRIGIYAYRPVEFS